MVLQEKIKKAELYEANSNWEEAINLYNEIVEENNSVQNTEKFGFKVEVAEVDLENSHQIIINIMKNKDEK